MTTGILQPKRFDSSSSTGAALLAAIDSCVAKASPRELMTGQEVVDMLLDLRLIVWAEQRVACAVSG
jgi:hypothetical protein